MSGEGPESIPTSADPRSKRPTKKRALTPLSAQSASLDALFARPDQTIRLPPSASTELTATNPRNAPPEIVANVQGSSAGAGSGEFHVYKQARRREYERLKAMDLDVKRDADREEFEKEKKERESRDEEKTRKNREKREKMKARKGKKGKGGGGSSTAAAANGKDDGKENGEGKTKGIAANTILPRRNGDDDEDDSKNETADTYQNGSQTNGEAKPAAADTPGLVIHDDD